MCVCVCLYETEAQQRPYYADYSPARLYIHTLCTNHYLDLFITFIICINVVTMSIEHYNQPMVSQNLCEMYSLSYYTLFENCIFFIYYLFVCLQIARNGLT